MSLYVCTYCHIHGTLVSLGVTQDSFHRTQRLGGGGGGPPPRKGGGGGGGGGVRTPHLKGVGMLVGNFELNR